MKGKIFLILILSLLIFPLFIQTKNYSIVWDPARIEETIGLGDTKEITVTFISGTRLQNVDLWVVPELQPFVSLETIHFDSIEANNPYEIQVHFYVPIGTQTRLYDGTIHLRVGSKTYPQTLKVELDIVDVEVTVGPDGGTVITTDEMASVTIPSDSVGQDTDITISPVTDVPLGYVGAVYEFGPDGISIQ